MSRVQTLAKQLFVATQVFCWWAIVCCGAVALVDLEARGPAARILIRHSLSYASVPGRHLLDSPVQRGIQRQVRRQLSQAAGAELAWISTGRNTGVDVLEVPQGSDAASIVQALRNVDGVEFAELDIHVKAYGKPRPGPPDDTEFWRQWGMHRLGLYTNLSSSAVNSLDLQGTAWNRSTGSDDVIVCVIDSGIDYNHPDLQANLWVNHHEIPANGIDDDNNGFVDDYYGWNFLNNSAKTMDDYFHGTHLAGIVGAVCNNELGVCGVNQRVKVMACKFLDQFGNGYTSNAVQCLDYALQMGAHISLNSYGGLYADSDGLRTAIGFAEAAGQLFVTAAGNDYGADIDQTPTFPAAYPNDNILSVIATNQSNLLANYSNYGAENADLAAPGSEILSTVPAAQYGWHTGTSQSAGFAAGAAALLLAAYQQAGFDISNCGAAVKAVMMGAGTTSQPGLADTCVTGGMLDLSSAMAAIPKQAPPPVPSAQPRCTHSTASTAQRWNVCQTCSLPWGIDAGAPGAAAPQVILPATQTSGSSKGDVKTKSLSLSDPFGSFTPSLTGPPASPVQVFSEIFGLQHSSLTLTPVAAGGFNSCLLKGVRDFQSDAAYGEDITATLLIPASAGKVDVFLPEAMPFKNGRVGSVSVTATGTLLLAFTALTTPPAPTSPPTAFGEPGGGSPPAPAGRAAPVQAAPDGSSAAQAKIAIFQAQELVSLAGSDVDLAAGGQVLHYLRPDRLVVSFLNVMSASSRLPSSFQAELFFRDASQPKGSIRLTWLDMAVQGALVGVSLGPACPAIQTDFALAVPCFQPATLSVSPARLPEMVQSSNAAMLHLTLSNTGNASLVVGASLETVGDNLLQPALWLNDALDYQKTYEQGSKTCSTYDPLRDPVCATFNISRQTVTYIGNYPKPMRFMQALKAPLRVVGTYVRNQQCSGQYIVLSSRPTPPTQFGWVTLDKQVIKLASGQASGLHLACSGSLQAGNYGAELVLRSNDPNRPVLRMPIKLWERQIPALVAAGYRVIAPDLRGFGDSERPERVEEYRLSKVQEDVETILDQLEIDRFFLVGHDWGAALAWRIATTWPQRVLRLVCMSVGHPGSMFSAGGARQRQLSWYFLFFQYKDVAEAALQADDWALMRQWLSPMQKEQVDAYIADLSRPGALTAGLNWYRANFQAERFAATKPVKMPMLPMPVLGIWSAKDGALGEMQMVASRRYVAPGKWQYARVENAGHWIPREAPKQVNKLLLDFLAQPFSSSKL
ncbi:hypothetical protein WJX72_009202 [[Myrmecia] bisecta]|uniref:Uncharacterized protein n=1 Tax=[Myrmecia] bisecta TaxID=41462 RepID=A0AAW1Q1G0_9CHLO